MPKNHYMKHTKLYSVWNQMRNRCSNPNDKSYKRYGAKGISVCEEWRDFRVFYPWAIQNGYKEGLTLDRIDPSGNYEPSNCRWITNKEQQRNRGNNVRLSHDGKCLTIGEWCEINGVSYSCIKARYYRLKRKQLTVTYDDIFSLHPHYRNRKIAQYTLDGKLVKIWDKQADCERAGFEHGAISLCCSGKLKKTHGFVWKYAD